MAYMDTGITYGPVYYPRYPDATDADGLVARERLRYLRATHRTRISPGNLHMQLNDQDNYLIACTGIHGCWILKHGWDLPQNTQCVKHLMACYQVAVTACESERKWLPVTEAVDRVIDELLLEPLAKTYREAVLDLKRHERRDNWLHRTTL